MQRRRFLTALLGTLTVVLPAGRAAAVPAPRRVLIQESPVAGFQYHAGERLWRELREGDALTLAQARSLARDAGLAGRTEYRQGDFVDMAGEIEPADVTLLDKVVCCYPDAEALVTRSVSKTRRVYALTYPRDLGINRIGARVLNFCLWLLRSGFRTYVHDPRRIESWIAAAGFKKRYDNRTFLWLTQVYVRG